MRLAVDVGATGDREDRGIRSKVGDDPGPVTRAPVDEQRTVGRLEEVCELPTVVGRAVRRRLLEPRGGVRQRLREELEQRLDACNPFLRTHAQVSQALRMRIGGRTCEQARVQRRIRAHADVVSAVDGFATRHRQDLCVGHAVTAQHTRDFVGADDDRTGRHRDRVDTEHVVEVRVADEHEVGRVHLARGEADLGNAGRTVEIGVEEQREPVHANPKGRAPEPLELQPELLDAPAMSSRSMADGFGSFCQACQVTRRITTVIARPINGSAARSRPRRPQRKR